MIMLGPDALHAFDTALVVVPSDDTVLQPGIRALYIGGHGSGSGGGGSGSVAVVTAGGQTVTFAHIPIGNFVPIQCVKVLATGTNATNILALL